MRLPGDAIPHSFPNSQFAFVLGEEKEGGKTVLESLTRSYIAATGSSLKTGQEVGNTNRTEVCYLKLIEIEIGAVANEEVCSSLRMFVLKEREIQLRKGNTMVER